MAKVNVGTTSVQVSSGIAVLRNLGPGTLYLEYNNAATVLNGFPVEVGESLSMAAGATPLFGISESSSDVRVATNATNISQ